MTEHTHTFQGQKLIHTHEYGDRPHGYFEHPEDGAPWPPDLPRYGLDDQPTTCPMCGSRTDFSETGGPDGEQLHTCLNANCRHKFLGFFDPEEFDDDGNFVSISEQQERDDDPCPCGKSHTRAEHTYDPDKDN